MWYVVMAVSVVVLMIGIAGYLVMLGASTLQRDIDNTEEEQWKKHIGAC